MVAVPAATPVTTPVLLFTVAVPVAFDVQAPPAFPFELNVEVPATQMFCIPLSVPAFGAAVTVIVPVAFTEPQPPTKRMLYGYIPGTDGVPKIVIVLLFHEAATPGGRPLAPAVPAFAIPVAPVVEWVMLVSAVLIHKVGVDEAAPAVLLGATVTVLVAVAFAHPPVPVTV